MAGRGYKLNTELIENIGKLLRGGNYVNTIVDYLGISEAIYYIWLSDAEKLIIELDKNPDMELTDHQNNLLELLKSVKKNSKQAEMMCVQGILQAGEGNWTAYAWYLERRNHKNWGRKSDVNITTKEDELTPEEKAELLAELKIMIKEDIEDDTDD